MTRISKHSPKLFPTALSACILFIILLSGCFNEPDTRQEKLQAIARWEDQRLAPQDSLLAMLADMDAHVRLASVRAAGLIGRDDVLPQMLDALQDQSVTVRAEAAWSLGLLGASEATEALEAAAADPRFKVRLAALAGLAHVPNDGQALMEAGINGDVNEATVAWDGLRGRAKDIDHESLLTAIQAGLTRPEGEIHWRVLHCIELVADSTLTGLVTPFARSDLTQIRVHAYRSLARLDNRAALSAVLEGFQNQNHFRGRDADRVHISGCRALGRLGHHGMNGDPGKISSLLITAAGNSNPHVSETALASMAQLVAEAPLPPEAAVQESLLPVWRIRMARSARSHLDRPHPGVRAAALAAYAAVRGSGSADDLVTTLKGEESPQVLAAGMRAISRHHPDPARLLVHYAEIDFPTDFGESERPVFHNAMVREAAYEGLAHLLKERPELVPDSS
ncbi:MAG: HEAT repeat domain-containing protein, partial [Candidatus Krumholzibacteria bacterium]|nr:HEAT repeat domain-containing protein [Candidatus Krumholzibacteria bacterium]